jgi:hypothetical protein
MRNQNSRTDRPSRNLGRRLALVGIVVALLSTSALMAHPRHNRNRSHHPKGKVKKVRVVEVHRPSYRPVVIRPARVVPAPRFIATAEFERYRPYRTGRVWVSGHGHYHTVYEFPRRIEGHYVVEPYAYCDGHRTTVTHLSYQGPNLSFGIRF